MSPTLRDEWITEKEALERYGLTRSGLYYRRRTYSIRAARFHKRLPLMLNVPDLDEADKKAYENDPTIRRKKPHD